MFLQEEYIAIFFSLQINKLKIETETMNYYGCLEFNFWNDEKYYFEMFLWKMIVTFFSFLTNKVDPNGEKMDCIVYTFVNNQNCFF